MSLIYIYYVVYVKITNMYNYEIIYKQFLSFQICSLHKKFRLALRQNREIRVLNLSMFNDWQLKDVKLQQDLGPVIIDYKEQCNSELRLYNLFCVLCCVLCCVLFVSYNMFW